MPYWFGRTKEQGERLQRQVLQFLTKEKAHPAMISTVAANLIDMLWEQNKIEEAETTLYQARQVPFCGCKGCRSPAESALSVHVGESCQ